MVVAEKYQHTAVARRAGIVPVPEGVARTVDAGALAVPDRENTVVFPVAADLRLLASPYRGECEVLVQPRLEVDAVVGQPAPCPTELHVVCGEGRAAIPGDVPGGFEARVLVAPPLLEGQAHKRLYAC